jgi:hypothetical protein
MPDCDSFDKLTSAARQSRHRITPKYAALRQMPVVLAFLRAIVGIGRYRPRLVTRRPVKFGQHL